MNLHSNMKCAWGWNQRNAIQEITSLHHNPLFPSCKRAPETAQLLWHSMENECCFPQQTERTAYSLFPMSIKSILEMFYAISPHLLFSIPIILWVKRQMILEACAKIVSAWGWENQKTFTYPLQFLIKHPGLTNGTKLIENSRVLAYCYQEHNSCALEMSNNHQTIRI